MVLGVFIKESIVGPMNTTDQLCEVRGLKDGVNHANLTFMDLDAWINFEQINLKKSK